MRADRFRAEDVAAFLKMAAAENWVVEPWEFDFLLATFPQGCFCMRDGSGKGIAFVTSLQHEQSGWIGNLIVAGGYRGRGFGEALFREAMEALHAAGVVTFWLTASESGRPLYEKYGFRPLDRIIRWVGHGRQRHPSCDMNSVSVTDAQSIISLDSQGWGDRREQLLAEIASRGRVVLEGSGFIVAQSCGEAVQLGPFSAPDSCTAEVLFETVLRTIPPGTRVFLDAPASNRSAFRLFKRKGMRITGRNELMYAGVKPDYRPEMLFGLATMGSCG